LQGSLIRSVLASKDCWHECHEEELPVEIWLLLHCTRVEQSAFNEELLCTFGEVYTDSDTGQTHMSDVAAVHL
jgi:hypothetical protein